MDYTKLWINSEFKRLAYGIEILEKLNRGGT